MGDLRNIITQQNKGDKHIDTGNFNNLVEKVNALGHFRPDGTTIECIRMTGAGIFIIPGGAGGAFPWEKVSFTLAKLSNASTPTATIRAGRVRTGVNAYVSVAETQVVLSNDPEYVCVRYKWADGTASVVAAGSTDPLSNEEYYYESYFKFEQNSNGKYIISTPGIFRFGDLVIPGAFGDG